MASQATILYTIRIMDVRSGKMRTLFAVCMAAAWVQQGKGAPCSAQEAGLNGCSSGLMQVRALDRKTRVSTRMRKLGEDVKKMIDRKETVEDSTLQELRDLVETWSKEIEEEVAGVKTQAQKYVADVAEAVSKHHSLNATKLIAEDARADAESLAQSMASKEFRFNRLYKLDWAREVKKATEETMLKKGYSQTEIDDSWGYYSKNHNDKKEEVVYATSAQRMETFKDLCFRFTITKYHCGWYADFYNTEKNKFEEQMGLFQKAIDEANDEEANRKKVSCYIDTMDKTRTQTVDDCDKTDKTDFNGNYTFTSSSMPAQADCDDTGVEKVSQDYGEKYTPKTFTLDSGEYANETVELEQVPLMTALGANIFTREKNCQGLIISYKGGENGRKGKCDSRGSTALWATFKDTNAEVCKKACNLDEKCLGFDTQKLTGNSMKCTWYQVSEQHCQQLGDELGLSDDTTCYVKEYNANFTDPCPKSDMLVKFDDDEEW